VVQPGVVQEIASPNYPQAIFPNKTCQWLVEAPLGHFLTYWFADLDFLSKSNNCTEGSYVETIDPLANGEGSVNFIQNHLLIDCPVF